MHGMAVRMMNPQTGIEYHFSPSRDIAYFWPDVVKEVKTGLMEKEREPQMREYIEHFGITEEELWDALLAYVKFCKNAVETNITTPFDAMDKSGFFECPTPAQMAVFAKLGQVCSRAFWSAIRSATVQGVMPEEISNLFKDVSEFVKAMEERQALAAGKD